jgi:hypothetical protein
MHNHYLPQYYLRGFCSNSSGDIWVYDKSESRAFSANVKRIANICGFYTEDIEEYLREVIESPANRVLDKIRSRECLDSNDKVALSRYIAVMLKRVPEGKSRLKDRAPRIAADLEEALHRKLDEIAEKDPSKKDFTQKRKAEIDEILSKFSQEPPAEIWHKTIPAETTPRIVEAVATMTWRFYTFDEKPAFLTCDNPVFFFRHWGIGRPESELSFPISSDIMLWATRREDLPEEYSPANMAIVKEMSRRMATNTTRYVFHAREENWILPFLAKGRCRLNRIQ